VPRIWLGVFKTIGAWRESKGGNMFRTKCINGERGIRYATAASFIEVYNAEIHSLFQLSKILTADPEKAEQCFVGALEECLDGVDVFTEAARLRVRRAIIKRAINLINREPEQPQGQALTGVHGVQYGSMAV
jgi:hypothetical protein